MMTTEQDRSLSSEANKTIARRLMEEYFTKGDEATWDELAQPDVIVHGVVGDLRGAAEAKAFYARLRAAFPDWGAPSKTSSGRGTRSHYASPRWVPCGGASWVWSLQARASPLRVSRSAASLAASSRRCGPRATQDHSCGNSALPCRPRSRINPCGSLGAMSPWRDERAHRDACAQAASTTSLVRRKEPLLTWSWAPIPAGRQAEAAQNQSNRGHQRRFLPD